MIDAIIANLDHRILMVALEIPSGVILNFYTRKLKLGEIEWVRTSY